MKILFAAPENAWGGFLGMIRAILPEHQFEATGGFNIETLQGCDVLIPTMCRITEKVLESADCLRLIQQCGSGLEGVDLKAATRRNIKVTNVPTEISGNADSVAELGIYMMIGLSRNFRQMAQSIADGKMGQPQGKALSGRTVGFVGLGGIAKALIKRLQPFGVRMIGIKKTNPEKAREELGLDWVGGVDDLEKLLERSDFVILALPLDTESQNIISRPAFESMRRDAFLINLSRGGLVDRGAMEEALATGKIAGAGLDVFWEEPPDPEDPVFKYNVLATPHIAGSTDISMQGIVRVVADNIRRIANNNEPLYQKKI